MKVLFSTLSIRNSKSEIPNITGFSTNFLSWDETGLTLFTGCFPYTGETTHDMMGGSPTGFFRRLSFDASHSSNRYGNYTEINPLYESTTFYIKY